MAHLTLDEMQKKLKTLGLFRRYKPVNDDSNTDREKGDEVILLECRKPASIVAGLLKGAEIDIYDDSTVRVWTNQKTKAMALAKSQGFRIRKLDGEAELFIPTAVADHYLHGFGAKVRQTKVMTPEQKSVLLERLAKARQARKVPSATPA